MSHLAGGRSAASVAVAAAEASRAPADDNRADMHRLVQTYWERGWAVAEDVFSADEVDQLAREAGAVAVARMQRIAAALDSADPEARRQAEKARDLTIDGSGAGGSAAALLLPRKVEAPCLDDACPTFRQVVLDRRVLDRVQAILAAQPAAPSGGGGTGGSGDPAGVAGAAAADTRQRRDGEGGEGEQCSAAGRLAQRPNTSPPPAAASAEAASLLLEQCFMKPPGVGSGKPFHQDNFFFEVEPPSAVVTAWLALDDADAGNGCLEYLSFSHRLGILPHTSTAATAAAAGNGSVGTSHARAGAAMAAATTSDAPVNDGDEANALKAERGEQWSSSARVDSKAALKGSGIPAAVALALKGVKLELARVRKGSIVFHHGSTIHRSGPNRSARWRRAYSTHWAASSGPGAPLTARSSVLVDSAPLRARVAAHAALVAGGSNSDGGRGGGSGGRGGGSGGRGGGGGAVWKFGYGSNMSQAFMRDKKGLRPLASRRAVLPAFSLSFPEGRGIPFVEPSFARLRRRADGAVHGVATLLPRADADKLDTQERSYAVETHELRLYDGTPLRAEVYVSRSEIPDHVSETCCSARYRDILVRGAEEQALAPEWAAKLRALPVYHPSPETLARRTEFPPPGTLPLMSVTELAKLTSRAAAAAAAAAVGSGSPSASVGGSGDSGGGGRGWRGGGDGGAGGDGGDGGAGGPLSPTPPLEVHTCVAGFVFKWRPFFRVMEGRDVTGRNVAHLRGLNLERHDDGGRPPFPRLDRLSPAELEYVLQYRDLFAARGGDPVAVLQEFWEAQVPSGFEAIFKGGRNELSRLSPSML